MSWERTRAKLTVALKLIDAALEQLEQGNCRQYPKSDRAEQALLRAETNLQEALALLGGKREE